MLYTGSSVMRTIMGLLRKLVRWVFFSWDKGMRDCLNQGLYEKLMSKYEADPEDPMAKFSRAQPKVS